MDFERAQTLFEAVNDPTSIDCEIEFIDGTIKKLEFEKFISESNERLWIFKSIDFFGAYPKEQRIYKSEKLLTRKIYDWHGIMFPGDRYRFSYSITT